MKTPNLTDYARRALIVLATLLLAAGVAFAQEDGDDPELAGFIALLLAIPVSILMKAAFQAVVAVLLPHWSAKARHAVETRRGVCLLWGLAAAVLVSVLFLVLAVAAQVAGAAAGMIGLLVLFATALLANFGFSGPAQAMGARLLPEEPGGPDRTPLQAFGGALVLALASLMPIIGWAFILALVFASLGAGLIAMFGPPVPVARPAGGGLAGETDELAS